MLIHILTLCCLRLLPQKNWSWNVVFSSCREKPLSALYQPARDTTHRLGEEGLQSGGLHTEECRGSGPGCGQQPRFLVWSISPENLQVKRKERETDLRGEINRYIHEFSYGSKSLRGLFVCFPHDHSNYSSFKVTSQNLLLQNTCQVAWLASRMTSDWAHSKKEYICNLFRMKYISWTTQTWHIVFQTPDLKRTLLLLDFWAITLQILHWYNFLIFDVVETFPFTLWVFFWV